MPYIGFEPTASDTLSVFKYVATSSQTTFTGSDADGATLSYDVGDGSCQVYLNGIKLDRSDITATNGTSVVLAACTTGDIIHIQATKAFIPADVVPKAAGGTFDGAVVVGAGAKVPSGQTLTIASGATIANSGTATGFGSNTAVDSITAGSTQTQAGATALTGRINRVTVSGTNGDGVKLPTAVAGLICEIINGDSAQTIDVWPATGDKIQGGSSNAVDPTSIAAGTSREFYCIDAAEWLRNIPVGTVLQREVFSTTGITNNATTTEAATAMTDTISLLDAGSAVRISTQGAVGAHRNANTPTNQEGILKLWRTAVTSGTEITAIQYGRRHQNPNVGDSWEALATFIAEDSPATKSSTTYVVGLTSIHTDVLAQWNGRNGPAFMILEEIAT